MDRKIVCALSNDLLLSYIEQLTNEESNRMIEEHLNECKKCKTKYEELIQPADKSEQNIKEIQFLAKYRYQLWGFIIGCVLTILVTLLVIAVALIGNKIV